MKKQKKNVLFFLFLFLISSWLFWGGGGAERISTQRVMVSKCPNIEASLQPTGVVFQMPAPVGFTFQEPGHSLLQATSGQPMDFQAVSMPESAWEGVPLGRTA